MLVDADSVGMARHGAARAAAPPAPTPDDDAYIPDEAEQDAIIAAVAAENARHRQQWRVGVLLIHAIVAAAFVYISHVQAVTPWGGVADYLLPLKGHVAAHELQLGCGVTIVVACVNAAAALLGRRELLGIALLVSALPTLMAAPAGRTYAAQWHLAWLPLAAPVTTGAHFYCERLFDALDKQIMDLLQLRFTKKSV